MKETYIYTGEIDWQEAKGYPAGAMQKVLHDGSGSAPRSILLKIKPGWILAEHAHIYTELHFVIEGEYQIHDKVYPAGTFSIIPKHTNHGPFTTSKGAVILVISIKDHQ